MLFVKIQSIIFLLFFYSQAKNQSENLIFSQVTLVAGENIIFPQPQIFIPAINGEECQEHETRKLDDSIEVLKLTKKFQNVTTSQSKLFTIHHLNSDEITIYIVDENRITSEFKGEKILVNGELLIERKQCLILANLQNCMNLFQLELNTLLLHCRETDQTQHLILFTNNGTVIDEYIIETQINCNFSSKLQFKYIWLFATQCQEIYIQQVEVDRELKFVRSSNKLIRDLSNVDLKSCGLILDLLITMEDHFYIITGKAIFFCFQEKCEFEKQSNDNEYIFVTFSQQLLKMVTIDTTNEMKSLYEISSGKITLNKQLSHIYKETYIIQNYIIIINLSTYLLVIVNERVFQIINISVMQANILIEYQTLIFLKNNGDLEIFAISPEIYSHNNQGNKFLCQESFNPFQSEPQLSNILSVQYYNLSEPQIRVRNSEVILSYFGKESKSQLIYFYYNDALPIDVLDFVDSEEMIDEIVITDELSCDVTNNSSLLEMFTIRVYNHHLFIFWTLGDNLFMHNCQTQETKNIINITQKYAQIFFCYNHPYFAITFNTSLIVWKLPIEQSISIVGYYNFSSQIEKGKLIKHQLNLQFQNCNIKRFNFLSLSLNSDYFNPPACKSILYNFENKILIEEHQITVVKLLGWKKKYLISNEILDADVFLQSKKLSIYQFDENGNVEISLYSFTNDQLVLMFKLPSYSYIYKYPLKIKISTPYFAVIASRQGQDFLLVYDINNYAANCLISVIAIDKGSENFDFFKYDLQLFYIYNNKVILKNCNEITLSLKQNIISDTFFFTKKLILNAKSSVTNELFNFSIPFILKNYNYQLKELDPQVNLITNNRYLTFENIIGNIQNIIINSQAKIQIQQPIQPMQLEHCYFYRNRICLKEQHLLIFDIFGLKKVIQQNGDRLNEKIFDIDYNQETDEMNVFYSFDFPYLVKQRIVIISQPLNKTLAVIELIKEGKFNKVSKINNLLIVEQYQEMACLYFTNHSLLHIFDGPQNIFSFTFVEGIHLEKDIYIFVVKKEGHLFISLVELNFLNTSTISMGTHLIKEIYFNDAIFSVRLFETKIIWYQWKNKVLSFEIVLFFNNNFACIFKGQVSQITSNMEKMERIYVLRYPDQARFEQVVYADDLFIIVRLQSQESLFLFDIGKRAERQMSDSIFELKDNQIVRIEKYNSSFFAMISNINSTLLVQLTSIGQYQLLCNSQCQQPISIILQNRVSQLTISIDAFENIDRKSFITKIVILVSDLWIIVIYLYFGSKRRNTFKIELKQQIYKV